MASAGAAKLLVHLLLNPQDRVDNPFRYGRFDDLDHGVQTESMVL
jgi:hypothetical protein